MPPYHHHSSYDNTDTPTSFRALGAPHINHEYEHKHEQETIGGRNKGPFDEGDIELQLGHNNKNRCDTALRVFRYISILFLGLVMIGTTLHIAHFISKFVILHRQCLEGSELTDRANLDQVKSDHHSSENRAPPEFLQASLLSRSKVETPSNSESITVPNYPPICTEFGCETYLAPGQNGEPIATVTILTQYPKLNVVEVTPKEEPRVTATSPPICVPPHCYPHPPPDHHNYHYGHNHHGQDNDDMEDPPRVTATSPPICVPPHCYPHPPPGQHQHDHHGQYIDDIADLPTVTDTSPPICVPPHCHPHPPPGHHGGHRHHHDDVSDTEDLEPNGNPPPCHPPHCYPPPSLQLGDRHEDPVVEVQEDQVDQTPPICIPPHCYPHQLNDEDSVIDVDSTPPICIPPHCNPHPTVGMDENDEIDTDNENNQDEPKVKEDKDGNGICNLPDCYPTAPPICYPTYPPPPGGDEFEVSSTQDQYIIEAVSDVLEMTGEDVYTETTQPICVPPICVPPAKSPPVCVPPTCAPIPDDGETHY